MGALLQKTLHFFFPPRCVSCFEETQGVRQLCSDCWTKIEFITEPLCDRCGLPFEVPPVETPAYCAPCLTHPPAFAHLRACFAYEETSRRLIMRFKHGDATYLTPLLVEWLAQAGHGLQEKCDVIVPVPLHWTRLFKRQYNQAAMLAQGLAAKWGKAYDPLTLQRSRKTPPQGSMSPQKRHDNVSGAFHVTGDCLAGKRVLLIDDVYTTGATITACCKILQKAGAKGVDVLTLARVVRSQHLKL